MKRLLLAAVVFGVLIAMAPTAWARKWTSSDGQFSTEAELVEFADGEVTLKKSSGETISVPLAALSAADRRFLAAAKKKLKLAAKTAPKADPSYTNDIQPFLATFCAKCHNQNRAEHGYAIDTFAGLTRSGKKGAVVVPGKPAESLLIQLFQPGRKHMPPNDSPQPMPEQITKVTAWIAAGADDDTAAQVQEKVHPEKRKPRR